MSEIDSINGVLQERQKELSDQSLFSCLSEARDALGSRFNPLQLPELYTRLASIASASEQQCVGESRWNSDEVFMVSLPTALKAMAGRATMESFSHLETLVRETGRHANEALEYGIPAITGSQGNHFDPKILPEMAKGLVLFFDELDEKKQDGFTHHAAHQLGEITAPIGDKLEPWMFLDIGRGIAALATSDKEGENTAKFDAALPRIRAQFEAGFSVEKLKQFAEGKLDLSATSHEEAVRASAPAAVGLEELRAMAQLLAEKGLY